MQYQIKGDNTGSQHSWKKFMKNCEKGMSDYELCYFIRTTDWLEGNVDDVTAAKRTR